MRRENRVNGHEYGKCCALLRVLLPCDIVTPMTSFRDRVRHAMELLDIPLLELDRRIGRSMGYSSRLVNPTPGMKPRDPRGESISAIAHALNVRAEWLLSGELPMRPVPEPGSVDRGSPRSRAEEILRLEQEWTEGEIADGSARVAAQLEGLPERTAREWRNEIELEIRAARRAQPVAAPERKKRRGPVPRHARR